MASVLTASGGFALSAADRERLQRRVKEALRRARRHGEALAAITVAVDPSVDPSAVIAASRRRGEAWFCFEQPDRDRAALGALGTATALEASGPDRFKVVAKRWRTLASH
ncbi:MAG: isochorismate synthase, partial [Conexibacter sp.]|nr:isochorismate synthase [Conexibacter sp.]